MTPHDALATRSRAYTALGLRERQLTDDELLDLFVAEPTLLKRPLVVTESGAVLGFDAARLRALADAHT